MDGKRVAPVTWEEPTSVWKGHGISEQIPAIGVRPARMFWFLDFPKCANQIAAANSGAFEQIAFAKMRPRLQQVLRALQIDMKGQSMDEALTRNGRALGAASLIRCGLSLEVNGKLVTSGTIMPRAARDPFTLQVMRSCIATNLGALPLSVRKIVLLGTTDTYVKSVKILMRDQFPDYREINAVAFTAQKRTWVFAAHPSPANGEFNAWLTGDASDASGCKRMLAQQALGVVDVPPTGAAESARPTSSSAVLPTKTRTAPLKARGSASKRDEVFARSFHLVRDDGRKVAPVMIKDKETGRVAFRVVKQGNLKKDSIEVKDEGELLHYCESGQYLVRARPLDKSAPANLIRPLLRHRIVKGTAS